MPTLTTGRGLADGLRTRGKAGSIQIGRILQYCTVYFVLLMFLNPNSTDTGLNTTYFADPYAVLECAMFAF